MTLFLLSILAILLVALLSRDHGLSTARDTVVSAELNFDEAALAVFPDRIHLAKCSRSAFDHPRVVRTAVDALRSEGFEDAGTYAIIELPGVHVVLAANIRESMYAVIHDHQRAGVWIDIITRYLDGTRWTHSTLGGQGLDPRPSNLIVRLPGATTTELLARARGDRPKTGQRRVNRIDVGPHFEQGYADWIAWRKQAALETTPLPVAPKASAADAGETGDRAAA
jgi:hypothetical protein